MPPSRRSRRIRLIVGALSGLCLLIGLTACGGGADRHVAADGDTLGDSDEVVADVGDVPERDTLDGPPHDAADGDADEDPANDTTSDADRPDADVLVRDTADDSEEVDAPDPDDAPFTSDWVPSGEWVRGPCPEGTLPGYFEDEYEAPNLLNEWLDVGADGLCVCYPGACFEIPEGAFTPDYLFGAFAGQRAVFPQQADSMGFYVTVADESFGGTWEEAVNPFAPWRVAIRAFSPALIPGVHENTQAYVRFSPFSLSTDDVAWPLGGGWVTDDVWAFEWYPSRLKNANFYLAHVPDNICGDGVIGPDEQCDDGDGDIDRGCHACRANGNVTCRGEPSVCLLHCRTVECIDEECEVVDVACEAPGPCLESACDSRFGGCVSTPTNEGEPCATEAGDAGWCEAGACVPTPRECVRCADGGRWIDGVCWPVEAGSTWSAEDPRTSIFTPMGYEDGVWHVTPNFGPLNVSDPSGGWRGWVGSMSPVSVRDGWLQVQYRRTPWTSSTELRLHAAPVGLNIELHPPTSDWVVETVAIGDLDATGFAFQSDALPLGSGIPDGGTVSYRRIRISEQAVGVCEEAVDVDGEWVTCMERVGMAWCGDACADLLYNDRHCGECGHVCPSGEHCIAGACVCDPALQQYAPDHCDGCDPGYYGFACDAPCPGVEEAGQACSGHGSCWDGPFGVGRCDCDSGWHGNYCQHSCSDLFRNGREQGVDCGIPVCPACSGL